MDRIDFVEGEAPADATLPANQGIQVKTDKAQYGNREAVTLHLDGIPQDAQMSVSVFRKDILPGMGGTQPAATASANGIHYAPELEGLIIEARPTEGNASSVMQSNLSVQGDDIQYYAGQQTPEGTVHFYTTPLQGVKEMITGMEGKGHLELVSPFIATPPAQMQPITLYRTYEEALTERSLALQAIDHFFKESTPQAIEPESLLPPNHAAHNILNHIPSTALYHSICTFYD